MEWSVSRPPRELDAPLTRRRSSVTEAALRAGMARRTSVLASTMMMQGAGAQQQSRRRESQSLTPRDPSKRRSMHRLAGNRSGAASPVARRASNLAAHSSRSRSHHSMSARRLYSSLDFFFVLTKAVARFLGPVFRLRKAKARRAVQSRAAFLIQCMVRRRLASHRIRRIDAAMRIARLLKRKLQRAVERRHRSATKMQATVRGYLTRRRMERRLRLQWIGSFQRVVMRKVLVLRAKKELQSRREYLDARHVLSSQFMLGYHRICREEKLAWQKITASDFVRMLASSFFRREVEQIQEASEAAWAAAYQAHESRLAALAEADREQRVTLENLARVDAAASFAPRDSPQDTSRGGSRGRSPRAAGKLQSGQNSRSRSPVGASSSLTPADSDIDVGEVPSVLDVDVSEISMHRPRPPNRSPRRANKLPKVRRTRGSPSTTPLGVSTVAAAGASVTSIPGASVSLRGQRQRHDLLAEGSRSMDVDPIILMPPLAARQGLEGASMDTSVAGSSQLGPGVPEIQLLQASRANYDLEASSNGGLPLLTPRSHAAVAQYLQETVAPTPKGLQPFTPLGIRASSQASLVIQQQQQQSANLGATGANSAWGSSLYTPRMPNPKSFMSVATAHNDEPPATLVDEIGFAYGRIIETSEALGRQEVERVQGASFERLINNFDWSMYILATAPTVDRMFLPILFEMYPRWAAKRAVELFAAEAAGRQRIEELFVNVPVRPPWDPDRLRVMPEAPSITKPRAMRARRVNEAPVRAGGGAEAATESEATPSQLSRSSFPSVSRPRQRDRDDFGLSIGQSMMIQSMQSMQSMGSSGGDYGSSAFDLDDRTATFFGEVEGDLNDEIGGRKHRRFSTAVGALSITQVAPRDNLGESIGPSTTLAQRRRSSLAHSLIQRGPPSSRTGPPEPKPPEETSGAAGVRRRSLFAGVASIASAATVQPTIGRAVRRSTRVWTDEKMQDATFRRPKTTYDATATARPVLKRDGTEPTFGSPMVSGPSTAAPSPVGGLAGAQPPKRKKVVAFGV